MCASSARDNKITTPIKNEIVVNGNLDDQETHMQMHKEALQASGVTIFVILLIILVIYFCYTHRKALRDSQYTRAARAAQSMPMNVAATFPPPVYPPPYAQQAAYNPRV